MRRPALGRKSILILILCTGLGLGSETLLATDSGIRVHRANQYYQLKNRLNKEHTRDSYYNYNHDTNYRKRHYSRQPVVPDSRFPNSYLEYNYQQRIESQYYRDR